MSTAKPKLTTGPITEIGFVGLGQMGQPMAALIAKAGYKLRVFDANPVAASTLAAHVPAMVCTTAADVAVGVQVYITMLPDGRAVQDVLIGSGKVAGVLAPGAIVADMSSSDPVGTRRLGEALAKRGVILVDAPVSGGVARAKDGTLSIMAGGDAEAIERLRPVFEKVGNKVFLTGPLGSGHAMKALNNYVSAAGLVAAAEALLVGRAFGLDPEVMTDVLNASTGRNNSTDVKLKQHILSGKFGTGFSVGLMAKDLVTASDLAETVGAKALFARQCSGLWSEAARKLGPGADHTEIYRYLEERGKK